MRRLIPGITLALWLILIPTPARAQTGPDANPVSLLTPVGGAPLQGVVPITGSANPAGFFSYEVSFGYAGDTSGTWFIIAESFNPVQQDTLAEWDTFAITDGDYTLRLLVTLVDASQQEVRVENVRVRNYTPIETSTPTPTLTPSLTPTIDRTAAFTPSATPTITPTPSETPTPTVVPTATPLPPNPAEMRASDIANSLVRGAAGVLAAFILLGMYVSIWNVRRK
jgi:hypothetical protein